MTQIMGRAVEMIRCMPDVHMFYVVNILLNLEEMASDKDTDREQAMKAFYEILEYRGRLSEDFDAGWELAEAREEKYGDIG